MSLHNNDNIIKKLRFALAKVNLGLKDIAIDYFVNAISSLHEGNYKAAYFAARQIYRLSGSSKQELTTLFHHLLFAEDVVTSDSVVFIHEKSLFNQSLKQLANELGFSVQEHKILASYWTKDYMISTGDKLIAPVRQCSSDYLTSEHIAEAQVNSRLYYGALNMNEHHQGKTNITSEEVWNNTARSLIKKTNFVHKTLVEGGNFFCAVNKQGKRFYLLGENVVSETIAYNLMTRSGAIELIRQELGCTTTNLLIIPQWTYHLDLQMAYLGRGEFVIHSFDQQNIDFGLSTEEAKLCTTTFNFLKKQFEETIINTTIKILIDNGFAVNKVFGCLFYLENVTDPDQLKFVPYCKSSDGFDGALALMMNGIAMDLGDKGRHFMVARCDLEPFKQQYESSLKQLNIDLHSVDMLEAYSYQGFEGMAVSVYGAQNVTQVSAFMNGALRCQTSLVSKALCKEPTLELSRHQFFKKSEYLNAESLASRFEHAALEHFFTKSSAIKSIKQRTEGINPRREG